MIMINAYKKAKKTYKNLKTKFSEMHCNIK